MPTTESSSALRSELERRIRAGQCVYCRAKAGPDRPLTREHVIPRARGGRRKDARIIVPACARCNHLRGSQELVIFLLTRPRRISAFLDYLCTLPQESVRQVDLRVFAELLTAVWILHESAARGCEWRSQMKHLSSGRALHRRRYAARRVVGATGDRLLRLRERGVLRDGPSCLIPREPASPAEMGLEESPEWIRARLVAVLSLAWHVSAEEVNGELLRALSTAGHAAIRRDDATGATDPAKDAAVLSIDGWKRSRRRRRSRVDQRRGRAPRMARRRRQ